MERNALVLELENSGEGELLLGTGSVVWGQKLTITQRPIKMAAKAFPFKLVVPRAKLELYIGTLFYTSAHNCQEHVVGHSGSGSF